MTVRQSIDAVDKDTPARDVKESALGILLESVNGDQAKSTAIADAVDHLSAVGETDAERRTRWLALGLMWRKGYLSVEEFQQLNESSPALARHIHQTLFVDASVRSFQEALIKREISARQVSDALDRYATDRHVPSRN